MARRRTHLEKRGRAVLLAAVGAFVLAQLAGGWMLDYRWPQLRFPAAYRHFQALEQQPHSPDVLYLGSSRSQNALSANILTEELRRSTGAAEFEVFDGAIPAGDPIVMEFAFAELTKRGARPDLVILEVTPESLNVRNDLVSEHLLRQLRWEDLPHYLPDVARTRQWGRLFLSRFLPLFVHRYALVSVIQQEVTSWASRPEAMDPVATPVPPSAKRALIAQPVSRRGEALASTVEAPPAPHELDPQYLKCTARGLVPIRRYLRDYQVGGRTCEALERLLAACRAQGCRVLLMGAPVTSAQRVLYVPAIDAQYHRYLNELHNRFGCDFVDCRDWIPDHLFLDNHHALPEGGVYFSRRLVEATLRKLF